MAYNVYPPFYQQMNIPPQVPQQVPPQNYAPQGFQNQSNFVPVPSEEVARNYPVAAGNSVTFKNENAPYIYTKTMGYSQLDRPVFEKYKLIREDTPEEAETKTDYNEQIKAIWGEIEELKKKIEEYGA